VTGVQTCALPISLSRPLAGLGIGQQLRKLKQLKGMT